MNDKKGRDFLNELVTLNQRVIKIKFYLNQTAQNIIEVGKELTAAKAEVPHGEWQAWLNDNFSLSYQTAAKFMQVAERFSNVALIRDFNSTQLITMLALPAADTEKFIEQKAAEGTPVEDMTIKTLRAEIAKYKADVEAEKAKVENLFADFEEQKQRFKESLSEYVRTAKAQATEIHHLQQDNSELQTKFNAAEQDKIVLQAKFDSADSLANRYHTERDNLQRQLQNQKPITVEPADYQQLKKSQVELQNKIDALKKELNKKTVEVVAPADYDDTKKELARLQAEQSEMVQRMDVFQKLSTVASLMQDIIKSPSMAGVQDFMREYPEEFGKMCAAFLDFTDSFYKE